MDEILTRIADNLMDRVTGPMHLRLYMQPLMAAIFAIKSGLDDAKHGRPPYFWALFTNPAHRRELLKSGWASVGKVFLMALGLDVVYQVVTQRWVYPLEALIVACLLAIVPYLALRGLVTRLARSR